MIHSVANAIASTIMIPLLFLGGLFIQEVPQQTPVVQQEDPVLGVQLPEGTGVFETSLASPISSSATSLTLTSNSIRGGGSISGYNCFTIDEGTASSETVCGTVSGTSVTSLTRGISQADGTTEDTDLQFSHRRGANIKITNFPLIQLLKQQNNGEATFENPLQYSASLATSTIASDNKNLVNVELLNSTAFDVAGIVQATETSSGFVELATKMEQASSTPENRVLQAKNATSTYNSGTADLKVVVTQNDGKIDPGFIEITESSISLGTTTPIGSFPAWQIGKNIQVLNSTGTSTWDVPSGITKAMVQIVGAGGGGGSPDSANESASGGGAGGYAMEFVDLSATSTVQYFIGTGGSADTAGGRTTFGTIGFEFLTATGGQPGSDPAVTSAGGLGGVGSGGDINQYGSPGGSGDTTASSGAHGGASFFGGGGLGGVSNGAGGNGLSFGAGGGGGHGTGNVAGSGANGVIIIIW